MAHIINANIRAIVGAAIKGLKFDGVGFVSSLVSSFSASANGCGIPLNPTLLGPFRKWKYPKNFRSIKV
jgi:hypothetical protein